ncbi:hypothetical protein C0Q70_10571 [Pomacea canaliculata]|uniref:CARD domain-containing protein n=1 Tax=Pomacea canaliculata TaxID=400727 RepID=A0A2T7P3J2_POMCA|nr:sterile alpha motif domain-containing protein 9-like [Pomacea canaliculata]PVD27994.1 hypothetical protein C0Q70_10571 [Pomacea canaliculata]
MGSDFKEILRANLPYLEEHLQVDEIVDICYSKKVLTQNDRERIVAERSRPDRAIKFVNILICKKDKDYQEFLDALIHENVKQDSVRKHLEAASVSAESSAGHDEERLVEQILKDCFEVKEGESCPADEFLKYVKLMLRKQQKSLEMDDNAVFKSATLYHTSVQLKKNRRKNVVAVQNLIVKSSTLYLADVSNEDSLEDTLDIPESIALEDITPVQVVKAMRCQLEKMKLDVTLAERMEEEEVDGKSLSQFTEEHIKETYSQLKIGTRIKLAEAIRLTLEDLKKVPFTRTAKAEIRGPKKLETYRKFDTRPGLKDVYEKGYVLPEEQSRPGQLLQVIHKYHMVKNLETKLLAEETVKFAAACMNERVNGTIHFGVMSKYNGGNTSHAGSIVGLNLDEQLCEVAITEEIYRAFYPDQRDIALKCIRDPVYIPVVGKEVGENSDLYVVEVDVVPHTEVVMSEAFFLSHVSGKRSILFRYLEGSPVEVCGQELLSFMESKGKLSNLRRESEKAVHSQPSLKEPNLHKKLHHLFTDGNDYSLVDIFPVLLLSSRAAEMTNDYLTEHFGCIRSLQPIAVFDFDPCMGDQNGQPQGLYKIMETQHNQVYKVLTTDNFDKNSDENKSNEKTDSVGKLLESIKDSSLTSWIFCNGYEPLKKMELQAAAWRKKRAQGFKEAVRFYSEQIPAEKARILIFLLSRNYDVILGALDEIFVKFPEQWIILAESEKVAADLISEALRRSYVEKEMLEERTVIGMPWSHVNQSIINIFGYDTTTGCSLPSSTGTPCLMKESKRNELSDLEVLSATECKDEDIVHSCNAKAVEEKKRQMEEDFYRGKEVTWWNFWFQDQVLQRAQFKDLLKQVKKSLDGNIPEDEKVAVITLYHQPGAGGTTTAREILWVMKEEVRCCVVKKITDQTCDQIAKFRSFEEQDNPKPPLVLIDNEDEEKVFQLCSHMNEKARREARDTRGTPKLFCVLIICIRMTAFPRHKDGIIKLGHELQEEERQWFQSKYQILERRYTEKKGPHPKLLISFNILKENFSPNYIKRTVEEFVSEIGEFKERRLLKYISLINSFDLDFQAIPTSCFNIIMTSPNKKKANPQLLNRHGKSNVLWEASLSQSINILLNRTSRQCLGGDIQALRIINNNFSREILNNLREHDKQTVSDVAIELLHCGIFRKCYQSSVQNQLVRIIKDMLKKRGPYKKGRQKFSPIVTAIGEDEGYEKAAEVMIVGFEFTDDPMIAQQIARVYIHCQNWKEADKYARIAQDMRPTNSYLCDTYGQVSKEKLIGMWQDTLKKEELLEGDKAREAIDLAFQAINIFRREQKLSDEDCTTGYNNCGYFQELRLIVTLLDICRFLKPFKHDKGAILHKFLVDKMFIPDGLSEELGQERIKMLKALYLEYEKPMRRLEDEQIQLKEDSCYQYSPSYSDTVRDRRMFVHLQECLDTYFGEESDHIPEGLSIEEECEFRRRRVKRKGGNSLRSIYGLRDDDNAAVEYEAMHKIIIKNVKSEFCNAFDLRTVLNLTLARISLNKHYSREISMECMLDWTQKLYDKRNMDSHPSLAMHERRHVDSHPYLEAFLYFVMFHWPTDWRNSQNLPLCSCTKIKDVIKEWKSAFQNNHPAQIEGEGKKPDRRKGTTLFFLGEGEGFKEIVFHSELHRFGRQQKIVGDSIWDTDFAKKRLKKLNGTLLYGGGEMSVTIYSAKRNAIQIEIPTSFPIKDQSLWQKNVRFALGFCWSGPKAFSVTRDDDVDFRSVSIPQNLTVVRRYDRSREKMVSEEVVEKFWQIYFKNQAALEVLEKDMHLHSGDKKRQLEFQRRKENLEKERQDLLQKRTSVLQGPD